MLATNTLKLSSCAASILHDSRLPPQGKWNLRSSGVLRSVDWYLLMFRDNIPDRASRVKQSLTAWPFKLGQIGSPETSGTGYQSKLRNTPEGGRHHENFDPKTDPDTRRILYSVALNDTLNRNFEVNCKTRTLTTSSLWVPLVTKLKDPEKNWRLKKTDTVRTTLHCK